MGGAGSGRPLGSKNKVTKSEGNSKKTSKGRYCTLYLSEEAFFRLIADSERIKLSWSAYVNRLILRGDSFVFNELAEKVKTVIEEDKKLLKEIEKVREQYDSRENALSNIFKGLGGNR